jgi:hypothetical protein
VIEVGDRLEEPDHLLGAEDDRELPGPLGAGDAREEFVPAEGDVVEEAEGTDRLVVIAPGDVLLLDEMDEIGADLGRAQVFGRLAEMACEGSDPLDVDPDRRGREVAEPRVLDHALAQRSHDVLPC